MTTSVHIESVPLDKAYRLLNHGPTVLISSRHAGVDNVMAAAWCCPLDFEPPKLTLVIDRNTYTRSLVEASGKFVVQIPTARQAQMVYQLGTRSKKVEPDKLIDIGVSIMSIDGYNLPMVRDCSAWLICEVIPSPDQQDLYDLFVGEVVAAWADRRVFREGRWHFEKVEDGWRTLHHVAGGHFLAIGRAVHAHAGDEIAKESFHD